MNPRFSFVTSVTSQAFSSFELGIWASSTNVVERYFKRRYISFVVSLLVGLVVSVLSPNGVGTSTGIDVRDVVVGNMVGKASLMH